MRNIPAQGKFEEINEAIGKTARKALPTVKFRKALPTVKLAVFVRRRSAAGIFARARPQPESPTQGSVRESPTLRESPTQGKVGGVRPASFRGRFFRERSPAACQRRRFRRRFDDRRRLGWTDRCCADRPAHAGAQSRTGKRGDELFVNPTTTTASSTSCQETARSSRDSRCASRKSPAGIRPRGRRRSRQAKLLGNEPGMFEALRWRRGVGSCPCSLCGD